MDTEKRKIAARESIKWIEDHWKKGDTVAVTSHMKSIQWSPETAAKWKKAGRKPFSVSTAGDLIMSSGNKWLVVGGSVKVTAFKAQPKKKKRIDEAAAPASKSTSFLLHLLSSAKAVSAAKKELAPLVASMKKRKILNDKEANAFEEASQTILEIFASLVTAVAKETVNVESQNKGIDGKLQHVSVLAELKFLSKKLDEARKFYSVIKPKDGDMTNYAKAKRHPVVVKNLNIRY